MKPAKYRCPHCRQVVLRESRKAWLASYCDRTHREARLMRVVRKR